MLQLKESCLYLHDLEKGRVFYHDILELPIIDQEKNRHIFFRAGSVVFLCFNPEDSKKQKELPLHFGEGQQHVAFEVEKSKYDGWKTKIIEKEIEIIHEQIWKSHFKSFYFCDFEQNVVEIVMKGMWE